MKIYIFILFLFAAVCQGSCRSNEESLVHEFENKEKELQGCVDYIERRYINANEKSNLNRITVLLCGGKDLFMSDDYRVCDSVLERKMKENCVKVISIEKDVCYRERNFGLVIFEIDNLSSGSYYYYYSFCNGYSDYANSSGMKNIPLKKNWSLFVEKK